MERVPTDEAPRVEHSGFMNGDELVSRELLETEAWALISGQQEIAEPPVRHKEYQDNARTALMEALTASGHLSRVEIHGDLDEINRQVLSRLVNGWDNTLPGHELERRFAEICNELLIQKIHQAIVADLLPPDTSVVEISDYPEALRGYKLGYRDANQKGMVRSTHLQQNADGSYTRVIETISRSQGSWRSTFGFLSSVNAAPSAQVEDTTKAPDIVALSSPTVYSLNRYQNGAVDIMRRLDQFAGAGVIFGDTGARAQQHPTYEDLRAESQRREQDVEAYIEDLASLEQQLKFLADNGTISKVEQQTIFNEEVHRVLNAICTLRPNYAEDTFGKRAANYFYQASNLVARGEFAEAALVLREANGVKETITFCGTTIDLEEAQRMGLKVTSLKESLEKGKESWKWKNGVCRIESCPTRPGQTKIGPCNICRGCQAKFDKGQDPTKVSRSQKVST